MNSKTNKVELTTRNRKKGQSTLMPAEIGDITTVKSQSSSPCNSDDALSRLRSAGLIFMPRRKMKYRLQFTHDINKTGLKEIIMV